MAADGIKLIAIKMSKSFLKNPLRKGEGGVYMLANNFHQKMKIDCQCPLIRKVFVPQTGNPPVVFTAEK